MQKWNVPDIYVPVVAAFGENLFFCFVVTFIYDFKRNIVHKQMGL